MENLQELLDDYMETISSRLLSPSDLRRYLDEVGKKVSRAELAGFRQKYISQFTETIGQDVDATTQEIGLEQKLEELAQLSKEARECENTSGYIPTRSPQLDTTGDVAHVLLRYKEILQRNNASLSKEIDENRILLKENMAFVDELANKLESKMETTQIAQN